MIRVSAFYPSSEGKRFDMAYYCTQHIPMVLRKLAGACKQSQIDQGLGGVQPGSKPTYVAMAHFLFDSVESFQAAFAPHADAIMGDIPNYTDIAPILQVSEVRM